MESLRKTYILRVWYAAPAETASSAPQDERSDATPQIASAERAETGERYLCSVQPIASEEVHYFASIEETIRFIRNNAIAFRSKPG